MRRAAVLFSSALALFLLLDAGAANSAPEPAGWYAGDMHVHRSCGGAPVDVQSIYDAMVAQDVAVVSLLADMGNGEVQNPLTDLPLVTGQDDAISRPGRIVHWDAEWHWDATYSQYAHQALGGHLVNLGLTGAQQIWDEYTYPILSWARQQGGISGFAHMQYLGDDIPQSLNCCLPIEYPVEVALGTADYISEDVGGSESAIHAYYRLLNCGFRPGLAAGSDWPCASGFGGLLTFGQVSGDTLSYRGWIDAIAHGRTVVTRVGRGDFLALSVNGTATPGDEIQLSEAGDVTVSVEWTSNRGLTRTIELVRNGEVVATQEATPGTSTPGELTAQVSFAASGWLCARVMGPGGHELHTAAVFVTVAGAPVRASATDAQFYADWMDNLITKTSLGGVWSTFFTNDLAAAQARYQAAKAIYLQIKAGGAVTPLVVSHLPASDATGVAVGSSVAATFSEALDAATVSATTFLLKDGSDNPVAGSVAYDAVTHTATLTPTGGLAYSMTYTATLKGGAGGIADPEGHALAADVTWSFTTEAPDVTSPTVTSTVPASGAGGVGPSTTVTATFSEALSPSTVNTNTFELRDDATHGLVPATVSYSSSTHTATLTPSSPLASGSYTARLVGGLEDPRIKDLAGNALAGDYGWSFTVSGYNCPCTLWSPSTVPGTVSDPDARALELGFKFRAEVDGYVTGVRFYKGSTNSGTHIGSLWSSTGTLLASATFTGETASGWQEVSFGSPVSITANTTYIASYHTNTGHYSQDTHFFQAPGVSNPPLRAMNDGEDGPNGVYAVSATSVFPTSGFEASNYWVDVVFATSVGPDETAPTVVARVPASGATGVAAGSSVTATFSEAIDPATVGGSTFELRDPSSALVDATVAYDAGLRTATLDPSSALAYSAVFTATVKGGASGIKDPAGNALATDVGWSFTTEDPPPPPPSEGPGGPILVISSAANPFSRYPVEILRAEGLNEFTAMDISLVDAAALNAHDVVILGEVPLTVSQVTLLSDWVQAGGNLIAFRPDKQLAGLLGLTDAASTLAEGYVLVDTTTAAGAGIVGETIQFHGTADRYTLSGATEIARLYSDVATPAANPAVTLHSVGSGGGQAAAFTYDLARSVVLTRQGNPAWVDTERDLDAVNVIRADDMFFGPPTDPPSAPEWVNRNKLHIPQADEQQRLLANLILRMNADRKPLPRFWYFPKGKKAVIVMTGDDHGSGNTGPRFEKYVQQSPPGCSLDDWECVRATSYMDAGVAFNNAQAAHYDSLGFELALHVTSGCTSYTESQLQGQFDGQLATWQAKFPSVPGPSTHRLHCGAWSGWVVMPKVEIRHGMRADMDYYYWVGWPPNWLGSKPGMFTGSGIPMRFAELDGTIVDCYQVTTQLTDESGQSYPFTSDAVVDKALGPEGYYGAFCANMHTDYASHASSDVIVEHALARGVPVVSGRQILTWLDGRNGSSFGSLAWAGNTLSFNVTQAAGARNLEAMLPLMVSRARLTSLTRGGSAVSFRTETIKGITYAFFSAPSGSYAALYEEDLTPPVIGAITAVPGMNGTAVVSWTTDELSDSRVDYGTDPDAPNFNVSTAALVTGHGLTLAGLQGNTTYYFRVTSVDAVGNPATSPLPADPPLSFITPPPACFVDATVADFAAGTATSTFVSDRVDGEVILQPALATEFPGTSLPPGWSTVVNNPGGTVVVGGGVVAVDGAQARTDALFAVGRSLEFEATFRNTPYQAVGFGIDFASTPWVIVSTTVSGTSLYARTSLGGGTPLQDVDLGASYLNAPHRYRIDWRADSAFFYVDGTLKSAQAAAISTDLRVIASDYEVNGTSLTIDWLQMSPYAPSGTFTSRVYDAGSVAPWDRAYWTADVPLQTTLTVSVRSGNTPVPDESWSAFAALPSSGTQIGSSSRYLQYLAELASSAPQRTPVLYDFTAACIAAPDTIPPVISGIAAASSGNGTSEAISWTTDELASSRVDYGTAPGALNLNATTPGWAVSHIVMLTGLAFNTTYYYRVTSVDGAGKGSTSPAAPAEPLSFTTPVAGPAACFADSTVADFAAGSGSSIYVSELVNGEVILQPTVGAEFSGTALPGDWMALSWDNPGVGTVTVGGGVVTVDGARANPSSLTTYSPGRVLEGVATFQPANYQGLGFGAGDNSKTGLFYVLPFVGFGTGGGTVVMARVLPFSGSPTEIAIPGLTGAPHRYRVEWRADSVIFHVDGASVVRLGIAVPQAMRPAISDYIQGGPIFTVDWLRMTPYASPGTFTSRVCDAGSVATWDGAYWTADTPAGTALTMSVRSGNTPVPGGAWTEFTVLPSSGSPIGASSRYLQYRAELSSSDPLLTPTLHDFTAMCIAVPDTTPPVISAIAAASAGDGTSEAISWITDEPATSRVDYGIAPDALSLNASVPDPVVSHGVTLTGLSHSTTYYYRVTSVDLAGHGSSAPAPPAPPLSFVTSAAPPGACFVDSSAADFGAGSTAGGTYVSVTGDGEVILVPALGQEFSGTSVPSGWTVTPWPSGGGATFTGGQAIVNGALLEAGTTFLPGVAGVAFECVATFGAATYQHVGLAVGSPYAIIGTANTTTTVYARTSAGGDTPIPLTGLIGAPHRYRIVWTSSSVLFYVDGTLQVTHNVSISTPMRADLSDYTAGGPALAIDWVRVSPYTSPGSFLSRVFDSGGSGSWFVATWTAGTPAGTGLTIGTRTGNTPVPDGTWSAFTTLPGSGSTVGGNSRFIQYRADLSTSDAGVTPVLDKFALTCTYGPDIYPPVISGVTATVAPSGVAATVSWTTSEPATSRVVYGFSPGAPSQSVTDSALVVSHALTLTGLSPNATYYFRVTSADGAGNSTTEPALASPPLSFTTPIPVCAFDQDSTHFLAGTTNGTYVAQIGDGAVTLVPAAGSEFYGSALPAGWASYIWPYGAGNGTATVSGGAVTCDGARVNPEPAAFGPGRSVEFVATYQQVAFEAVGFAAGNQLPPGEIFNSYPWAIFSTKDTPTPLYARTALSAGSMIDVPLSTGLFGAPHRFRIDWLSNRVDFYVDGDLVSSQSVPIAGPMRPAASELFAGGGVLKVDWIRMTPYAPSGSFESRVFDAGQPASWLTANWAADVPVGTSLAMYLRRGDTLVPDASWTAYAPVLVSGGSIGGTSRYIQYRADLATSNPSLTPVLRDVTFTCCSDVTLPLGVADLGVAPTTSGNDTDGTIKLALSWTDPEPGVTAKVYRKGFGDYPRYRGGVGGEPAAPASPAAAEAAAWTLTAVTASGQTDEPPARDYWYYVVFCTDPCGNTSAHSNLAVGLDYLLGDVADGLTSCAGNNVVNTGDVSLLGTHYGEVNTDQDYLACLDVGPTTDYSTVGRPVPDGVVEFEDLVMFALNFGGGGGGGGAPLAAARPAAPASAASTMRNALRLDVPAVAGVGETFAAVVRATAGGNVQAMSLELGYDRAVVEMVGAEAGELLSRQGAQSVVLSPRAGRVDVVLLGKGAGMSGDGELVRVRFRVKAAGDPALVLARVDARDGANRKVELGAAKPVTPTVTTFFAPAPNPFDRTTTLSFALAKGGEVELAIYSVDGRKVATLADGRREAGTYRLVWNGAGAKPGLYYARLSTPEGRFTRALVLIR